MNREKEQQNSARSWQADSEYLRGHVMNILKAWFVPVLVILLPAGICVAQELRPGVVVESTTRNQEAEKAGLEPGDILLTWNRGDAKGEVESPFDLSTIEIEQAPRGAVTLEGLREAEKRSWTLGPDTWGLETRPNFQGNLLSFYRERQELAKAGKLS